MRADITPAPVDHVAVGQSRVTLQYQRSVKFLAFLAALLEPMGEFEQVFADIAEMADPDKAAGVQLDIIGEWVGISRIIENAIPLAFFGFAGVPAALPFGEEGRPEVGGRFYEEDQPYLDSNVLEDPEFRTLIKARIARNHTHGGPEDIIAALKFIFSADVVILDDPGGMEISISIGRGLTYFEQVLCSDLNILPKPAGVRIASKTYFDGPGFFGFSDQHFALPFGEEGEPSVGGAFAEEFYR